MGGVGAYFHQVGDAVAASSFGIFLKKFAYLEKQHDKHSLGEFGVGAWHKSDAQGTDGGYGHQKVFVEDVAGDDAFGGFFQCVVSYEKIGHKIYQQQLP